MLVPQNNTWFANGYALLGYTQYGIRWWVHNESDRFFRKGEADLLTPSQWRHMYVCEEFIRGAPVDAGESPKPWMTDNDIRQLLAWDLDDYVFWVSIQKAKESSED